MAEVHDFRTASNTPERAAYELTQTVFLVGFMGAGKTSAARKLARQVGIASVDMDVLIEHRYGKKVKTIFEEMGEQGFRAIETDLLRELAEGDPCIVSCGGGVVLAEENRRILRERGFVVYLKVSADEAASRISNVESRPLFGDLENARRVNASRLALYAEVADVTIDTAGYTSNKTAREVLASLKKAGVLHR